MLYYKEKIVNLGDLIVVNDFRIRLTQEIIDNNPDLFKSVEYVKLIKGWSIEEEYMGEVFELSTLNNLDKFQQAPSKEGFIKYIEHWIFYGYFKITTKEDFDKQELTREAIEKGFDKCPKYVIFPWQNTPKRIIPSWNKNNKFTFDKDKLIYCNVRVYYNGQWAKIVEPLIITDDNVELFEGDTFWVISKNDLSFCSKIVKNDPNFGILYFNRIDFMYFSTEELVFKYIKENTVKTLKDYEDTLKISVYPGFYDTLKIQEPKLYWTKVLQLIADDLNEEENLKHSGNKTFSINFVFDSNEYIACTWNNVTSGYVQFKNYELTKQAIKIMGSKLDYIYK